jgi:hydrogenase accessory protein HypB
MANQKTTRKSLSLKTQIMFFPILFLVGYGVFVLASYVFDASLRANVVLPSMERQILEDHKVALKALVEAEAIALGEVVKGLASREEKLAAVVKQTDPIRFFDDGSGYFFSYDLAGIRINVPTNKADNGKSFMEAKDKKGIPFVAEFVKVAKAGGGFVEYYFDKPGKGVQPKLSYIKTIPGTDFLVGTGVYIDNVQEESANLLKRLDEADRGMMAYKVLLFGVILLVVFVISFLIARRVTGSAQRVIEGLTAAAGQVSAAASHVSANSHHLAEGASNQASSLEETSSALEELSAMTRQNANNAGEANTLAVVDGDIATSLDADRAAAAGAIAVQINTGGDCHLDAVMLQQALAQLDLRAVDLLIVENVGNLVCPASFALGTHLSVLVASVPEGDDKPYKYPGMYRGVEALVINKIDLLPYVPFRMDYFRQGVELLNPGLRTFPLSCRTGEGLEAWLDWLRGETRRRQGKHR